MNKKILESLRRIFQYTGNSTCRTLSLALDIPELFDIKDKELLEALNQFEGMLEFNNISFETTEDEEDTY